MLRNLTWINKKLSIRSLTQLYLWKTLLVIFISSNLSSAALDDEVYQRKSAHLGATLTENLIKFYNSTVILNERVQKLLLCEPYEEERDQVVKLTLNIEAQRGDYNNAIELLNTPTNLEEGKSLFEKLNSDYGKLNAELENIQKVEFKTNEEMKKEYHALNEDLKSMTDVMLKDFVESAKILAENKLFPKSAKDKYLLGDEIDFEALAQVHELYKECHDLQLQMLDAIRNNNSELEELLRDAENDLYSKETPAFIKQHKLALSQIVPISLVKIQGIGAAFRQFDLEQHLDQQRKNLMEQVYMASTELDKLNIVREQVKNIYEQHLEKLNSNEQQNQHIEL